MKVYLLRHGATAGNLEHRYIGSGTDEPLCDAGIAALQGKRLPPVKRLFVSPMLRCRQTAAMVCPDMEQIVISGLRECRFGAFENKNYKELNGDPDYQRYIDSGGEAAFPGGESRAEFAGRSLRAFDAAIAQANGEDCAFVVHGGTIMAVMERYGVPKGSYFDFQVRNGEGFELSLPDGIYRKI